MFDQISDSASLRRLFRHLILRRASSGVWRGERGCPYGRGGGRGLRCRLIATTIVYLFHPRFNILFPACQARGASKPMAEFESLIPLIVG
jgi:hypothetical protein